VAAAGAALAASWLSSGDRSDDKGHQHKLVFKDIPDMILYTMPSLVIINMFHPMLGVCIV
jgi:hypothetical protein